jgi:predicted  nucleic acid-binding Zn-ribbon protein
MSEKRFNDPLTLEELTVKVIELDERVTRLETLVEEFRKTREELKAEMRDLRKEIDAKVESVRKELKEEFKAEIRRLDAKIDRFFWLWVSTIVAAFVLRVLRLV